MIFYAAVATLPFALPISRRALSVTGWAIAGGIGEIAVYVLVRMLVDGQSLFLAGRLNGPINYRNATALLFALPVWPFVIAAATRGNRRGLRATALSLATLGLGLAFLTQSRGIVLGLIAGGCVALAIGPDRVRRVWVALVTIGIVAAASPLLLRPFHAFDGGKGFATTNDITAAAWGLAAAAAVAFVVGMAIALFDSGLRAHSPQMRSVRNAARIALGAGAAIGLVGAVLAMGNPVSFAHREWRQFKQLNSATPTSTRYASVGGQRYDLWRVAVKEFESHPLGGVGAGNYQFDYYRERETNRNLSDPHSLLFSLLSEEGIIGVALFLMFLGGLAAALQNGWRRLDDTGRRHLVAPAAAGAVLIGQSMVDWIWLIPGLTAIGILALSVAGAQSVAGSRDGTATLPTSDESGAPAAPQEPGPGEEAPPSRGSASRFGRWRPVASAARVGTLATLLVAVAAVFSLFLSDAYIQRARTAVGNPAAQLSAAKTAASLDPWSVTAHYLEASAYETVGDRRHAYEQLGDALSLEPSNLATLGVLGDFEATGHRFAAARSYYRRALALDPLDTGLQQLARIGLRPRR
jgi:tetratricopeptide (TPR) repeat protein